MTGRYQAAGSFHSSEHGPLYIWLIGLFVCSPVISEGVLYG